jgi:DNA (cytosine-5)-methyltransferase 1
LPRRLGYIDLFAGAGGLSEGFRRAGFVPIAHVEIDQSAAMTLKTRAAYQYLLDKDRESVYEAYLKGEMPREVFYRKVPNWVTESVTNLEISKKNLPTIFRNIRKSLRHSRLEGVDLIVGGPPCQAYSIAGRSANQSKEKKKEDDRSFLYKLYGRFLSKYRPKMFVFENVPGLISANGGKYYRNLKKYFRRIGYSIGETTLDAADFGVVQTRRRIIIVGWQKDYDLEVIDFKKMRNPWTVKDVLEDLPAAKPGTSERMVAYRRPKNYYLSKFGIRNGKRFVTQHHVRPHNQEDLRIYRMAIFSTNAGKRFLNSHVPEEQRTQKNVTAFLDRFKVINHTKRSHTILAHIAKDGHYYIYPYAKQLRSISIREAARIQSFPDDYFFEGSRSAAFRQIGNAVPPLMAEKIAARLREII